MLSFEITDSQIKLVRGVQSGTKIRVQDADIYELSDGYVQNGYISEVPMVAAALSELLKVKNIQEKEAIVSITSCVRLTYSPSIPSRATPLMSEPFCNFFQFIVML